VIMADKRERTLERIWEADPADTPALLRSVHETRRTRDVYEFLPRLLKKVSKPQRAAVLKDNPDYEKKIKDLVKEAREAASDAERRPDELEELVRVFSAYFDLGDEAKARETLRYMESYEEEVRTNFQQYPQNIGLFNYFFRQLSRAYASGNCTDIIYNYALLNNTDVESAFISGLMDTLVIFDKKNERLHFGTTLNLASRLIERFGLEGEIRDPLIFLEALYEQNPNSANIRKKVDSNSRQNQIESLLAYAVNPNTEDSERLGLLEQATHRLPHLEDGSRAHVHLFTGHVHSLLNDPEQRDAEFDKVEKIYAENRNADCGFYKRLIISLRLKDRVELIIEKDKSPFDKSLAYAKIGDLDRALSYARSLDYPNIKARQLIEVADFLLGNIKNPYLFFIPNRPIKLPDYS